MENNFHPNGLWEILRNFLMNSRIFFITQEGQSHQFLASFFTTTFDKFSRQPYVILTILNRFLRINIEFPHFYSSLSGLFAMSLCTYLLFSMSYFIFRNSLPPRHAHPVVLFKCDRAEPMFNPEFPLDKYELDSSSPLVQYMLSRKEPNLCWQVREI